MKTVEESVVIEGDDDLSVRHGFLLGASVLILLGIIFLFINPYGMGWYFLAIGIPFVAALTAQYWLPGVKDSVAQYRELLAATQSRQSAVAAAAKPSLDRGRKAVVERAAPAPKPEPDDVLWAGHPSCWRGEPVQVALTFGLLAALAVGCVVAVFNDSHVAAIGLAAIAFVPACSLALRWLRSLATTLVITRSRVVLHFGLLSRALNEVRHKDIRNIQVSQSLFQRFTGIGRLAVSTAAQSDIEIVVVGIINPNGVANIIRQCQE